MRISSQDQSTESYAGPFPQTVNEVSGIVDLLPKLQFAAAGTL